LSERITHACFAISEKLIIVWDTAFTVPFIGEAANSARGAVGSENFPIYLSAVVDATNNCVQFAPLSSSDTASGLRSALV
jgi:hypothetical protein